MDNRQLAFPGCEARLSARVHAQPIIKWCGGKKWIIPVVAGALYQRLANTGGRYVEPFLGGGALALDLGLSGMILGDLCRPLMEMYSSVTRQPGAVAWALSALAAKGTAEENYYHVRDLRPSAPVMAAARFIYLNKLGFNGLYRENKSGGFNVPYGGQKYRENTVNRRARDAIESLFPSKGRLEAVSKAFGGAQLVAGDFTETLARVRPGDAVYADPPYAGTFDAYTAEGFGPDQQEKLATALREAHGRGAHVVSTNADTAETRELYAWADVVMLTAELRAVNSDGAGRGRVGCLLIATDMGLLGG